MRILSIRRAREEEGATAVIVVLCLIALFGMVVLVVDVGGLLLRRRELVNGSDAAALAAAKSCILSAAQDPRSAEQAADEWAAANVNGAVTGVVNIQPTWISGCDTPGNGYVTVRYEAPQDLFFAPVLGYSSQGTVATQATAIWGPPGAVNVIPIVVYYNTFNSCKLDTDPTPGALCYVWEDNSNTQGPQSGFGTLDLRTDNPSSYGWGSVPGAACSDPGNGPKNWIDNYPSPDVGDLPTVYPGPTYVCRDDGFANVVWASLENLIDDAEPVGTPEDDILFFPINRCYDAPTGNEVDGQIAAGSTPANLIEVACGDTPHQYDIIGFVALKLKAVYRPNDVQPTTAACPVPPALITRPFPSSSPLNLDTLGIAAGCFTQPPLGGIVSSSVDVTKAVGGGQQPRRGPDGAACTQLDWCFDPVGRNILWNPFSTFSPGNFNIEFDYLIAGPCGVPPSGGNSGNCLVVEYVTDTVVGGSGLGTGNPDSNIRAYKLCEPTIASTCAPINVPVP